jgi:hydrogenase maturation protease
MTPADSLLSEREPRRVCIIAWGNRGRGDDGAALALLERLSRRDLGPEVELIELHQLGPELAETLGGSALAIFVDADVSPENRGVTCRRVRADSCVPLDSHHVAPPALLALTAAIGLCPPPAWQIAIRAFELDYCDRLSGRTAALLPRAEARVLDLLKRKPAAPRKEASGRHSRELSASSIGSDDST